MATINIFLWKNIWWNNKICSFFIKNRNNHQIYTLKWWSYTEVYVSQVCWKFLAWILRWNNRLIENPSIHQLMQTIESQSINQATKPCLLHMGHSGKEYSPYCHELYFYQLYLILWIQGIISYGFSHIYTYLLVITDDTYFPLCVFQDELAILITI